MQFLFPDSKRTSYKGHIIMMIHPQNSQAAMRKKWKDGQRGKEVKAVKCPFLCFRHTLHLQTNSPLTSCIPLIITQDPFYLSPLLLAVSFSPLCPSNPLSTSHNSRIPASESQERWHTLRIILELRCNPKADTQKRRHNMCV